MAQTDSVGQAHDRAQELEALLEQAAARESELLAEIEEADLTLEETYTYGKFVPIPKPEDGKRVKVTMGRACVFVESDGQMTLWDANEKSEPYEPFGGEENNDSV